MEARPAFLDQLTASKTGRSFVLELCKSSKMPSEYGRSDLLSLCLREMVSTGHVKDLLQVCATNIAIRSVDLLCRREVQPYVKTCIYLRPHWLMR